MRLASMLLLACLSIPSLAASQFEAGMRAYEEQDYPTALAAFEPLAATGDPDAQYMLGRLYARGNGVIQDFVMAHQWFNLAAAGGHRQAPAAREAVATMMTPEQVATAQAAARRFQGEQQMGGLEDLEPLSEDGIPVVRLSPEEPPPPPPPAVDQGTVARIQLALSQQGYDIGPITGEVDEALTDAILDYQLTHFLPVDGHPSAELLARLLGESGDAPTIVKGATAPRPEPQEEWIWRRILLEDGFRDGDFSSNPVWQVSSGRFWVEAGRGLRSVVETGGEAQSATISLPGNINNVFAIELDLVSRENNGRLEFGPYQGSPESGYRLHYYPAQATGFELRVRSPSGNAVVARSSRGFDLESGGVHKLVWTRDQRGQMQVMLNGTLLLEGRDRGFQQSFDGFVLSNHGGDYNLRRISIKGGN